MIRSRAIDDHSPDAASSRLAILTTYHQPCGLATYAGYLVQALREKARASLVLAERTSAVTGPDDPNVVRCWTRDVNGGGEIAGILERERIGTLHINHGGMFAEHGWLVPLMRRARTMGIKLATTFHSTEAVSASFLEICGLSDCVHVHFPQNAVQLVALGADPEKIRVIPHGIPAIHDGDLDEAKRAVGWDADRTVVSTFGFVEPHKGVTEVVRAVHEVSQSRDIHLFVAGTAHPHNREAGRYVEFCKQEAIRLGIKNRVQFADRFLPDGEVLAHLRASDAIIMNYKSQRFEASGAAAVALSSGRPVITSQSPAFDYTAGLTIKISEQRSLAHCILAVITSAGLVNYVRSNLDEYVRHMGWPIIADRFLEMYEDCRRAEPTRRPRPARAQTQTQPRSA